MWSVTVLPITEVLQLLGAQMHSCFSKYPQQKAPLLLLSSSASRSTSPQGSRTDRSHGGEKERFGFWNIPVSCSSLSAQTSMKNFPGHPAGVKRSPFNIKRPFALFSSFPSPDCLVQSRNPFIFRSSPRGAHNIWWVTPWQRIPSFFCST